MSRKSNPRLSREISTVQEVIDYSNVEKFTHRSGEQGEFVEEKRPILSLRLYHCRTIWRVPPVIPGSQAF
jgi:hypothetical protein